MKENIEKKIAEGIENAVGMVAWNEDGSDTIEITEDLILQVIDMLARKNNKDISEVDNDTSEVNNAISFLKAKITRISLSVKRLSSPCIRQHRPSLSSLFKGRARGLVKGGGSAPADFRRD